MRFEGALGLPGCCSRSLRFLGGLLVAVVGGLRGIAKAVALLLGPLQLLLEVRDLLVEPAEPGAGLLPISLRPGERLLGPLRLPVRPLGLDARPLLRLRDPRIGLLGFPSPR